jgi:hypothetical protein
MDSFIAYNNINKIIMVEWLDAIGPTPEWEFNNNIELLKPAKCITIGILIDEQPEYITVAQSLILEPEDSKSITGRMTIPKGVITKITEYYENNTTNFFA